MCVLGHLLLSDVNLFICLAEAMSGFGPGLLICVFFALILVEGRLCDGVWGFGGLVAE